MYGLTICQRLQLLVRVSSNLLILALSLLAVTPTVYAQSNASSASPAAQQSVSIPNLELAKPIERQITGGDVHVYNLALKVDEYAHIDLDQRGIDLSVWSFDATGKKISEADAFRVGEKEQIALVADVSGTYRIEIHSSFPKAPTGQY